MSDALAARHRAAGADLRTGVSARAFAGEGGHVAAVVASDGARIATSLVLVGIGVVPNVELAAEAGLATEGGILVDETLRTADPAISAIGDCAAFPSRHAGGVVRLESLQNAQDQARCVAARLCGRPEPYDAVPWFWSDQGDQKLEIAGLTADHDRAVLRGDPQAGAFSVFCFRGERLLGAESLNRSGDHMAVRRILGAGAQLTVSQAQDEGFDLARAAA
jgi:3-phenylpropionate/trans-cinnamate dioxygenase ferredoxin reductase subunit